MSVNKVTGARAQVGALFLDNAVLFITGSGAPVDGVSGTEAGNAGPGSLFIDIGTGNHYRNTNTQASPTWTLTT